MAENTAANEQEEAGADVTKAAIQEVASESLSSSESKLLRMRKELAGLVEEHLQLCVTVHGDDHAGVTAEGDGQRMHLDEEDAGTIDDWVMPVMIAAELAVEIKDYRTEVNKLKHMVDMLPNIKHIVRIRAESMASMAGSSWPTTPDGQSIITCLKDLYTHPDGAPLHLLRDLPWLVGYKLTPKNRQQRKWQHHPLVQEERIRRHLWRLQNDPTGEYAAFVQQAGPTPHQRPARFALLKEMEQAEAGLQAAIVAEGEPYRLTAKQRQAIAALCAGKSFEEAGEQLAVEAATIEGWQKNPSFEAEIALAIEEQIASARQMALRLADKAIRCVEQSINTDRCPKSALAVLRKIGAMDCKVIESGLDPYVASAESQMPPADENGYESATWANAELNGYQSATSREWPAMENENGLPSATWRWEEEEARVTILDLPEKQRRGAISLVAGAPIERVATDCGTTVDEVRHWLRVDRLFQSVLNCKFRDKVRHLYCRLLALADTASEILAEALDSGQTKFAIRYLRGLAFM